MSDKPKILIADGDTQVIKLLETSLSNSGYEIIKAYDGTEILEKANNNNPDLVLLALDMPKTDGIEVCRRLKSKDSSNSISVIIMAEKIDSTIVIKGLNNGVDRFITKPLDMTEVSVRIKAMLRIKSLEAKIKSMNRDLEIKFREKTGKIQNVYIETIKTLVRAIDAKDGYIHSHSENIIKYAVAIAKEMGLSRNQIWKIEQAAVLHDIGKIGIHDYVLGKTGKLSEKEWKEVKQHSLIGAGILEPLEFLDGVVPIVKHHHERFNGSGYPGGLKGKDIDIGARILAVVDSYDNMISERPYRGKLSKEEAINELKNNSGTQFDPEIVEIFLRVIEKNNSKKR
jgi:putative two-component system response regulator